mmetsp:Transcript_31459/g.89802  ORF Transcript_31459/g.89802 Transcript_31459/m.89802 type:complete len:257 (-) Transcript_31459:650-1420(-)
MSGLPKTAAICKASPSVAALWLMAARWCSKNFVAAHAPDVTAWKRGVCPRPSRSCTPARRSSSMAIACTCPCMAATWIACCPFVMKYAGTSPRCFLEMSARLSKIACKETVSPTLAARNNGRGPQMRAIPGHPKDTGPGPSTSASSASGTESCHVTGSPERMLRHHERRWRHSSNSSPSRRRCSFALRRRWTTGAKAPRSASTLKSPCPTGSIKKSWAPISKTVSGRLTSNMGPFRSDNWRAMRSKRHQPRAPQDM